ncbi:ThiF family adenylyltransferase [Muricauda sp. SCSIO 64092]|uniref:ThiF family adenylyltransferase n=1 Tax=Allomuricauda sp. SCSIO 64092 TaxID=2908842 RepID=UPI001FF3CB9F|nr:ThiF family adenylyltransferase [Muricauda sp. SCSIO 64092]UOY05718.1 ThiF family adenylyltransferase [Muricauda sp. SCSIO 64092]
MARSLHSTGYEGFEGEISQHLFEDLSLLRAFTGKRKLKLLKWDDKRIAIPLRLSVELPPRGTYEGVDIRSKEDILFVFHPTMYPNIPPRVYSDRKSFPKDQLSHLYISKDGKPAPFCLVRGNYKEWYANKRITDLVIRVQNWLADAASGDLVEDGGQFDPMRLEGFCGTTIYKYHELAEVVNSDKALEGTKNMALLLIKELQQDTDKNQPSYEVVRILTSKEDVEEALKPIVQAISKEAEGIKVNRYMFGAIYWQEEKTPNPHYFSELPYDLLTLLKFGKNTGINMGSIISLIPLFKINGIDQFPIIVGVKRPKPLIGYSGDIEFFNFFLRINEDDIKENEIENNVRVSFQQHKEPLSVQKAREVSGSKSKIDSALIFGCGAVGSKVTMHLIREGYDKLCLLDSDTIEPHNMIRHALTPGLLEKIKLLH